MEAKEIFKKEHSKKNPIPDKKQSILPDERVMAVEEKLTTAQEFAIIWTKRFTQNEESVSILCVLTGMIYSYAINKCTGDFHVPWYAYGLAFIAVYLFTMLLINEGSLPLYVIVKFATFGFSGHLALMFLVALDSHYWQWFTFSVCRYPFGGNEILWGSLGAMGGYLYSELARGRK